MKTKTTKTEKTARKPRKAKAEKTETQTPVVETTVAPAAEIATETGSAYAGLARSVVKERYKAKYAPTKDRCGDAIADEVSTHCWNQEDDCLSVAKLRRFAEANGCWVETYARLNPGMQRMNVVNRLRGRIRRDKDFAVVWA